jgi:hypothetical protein
MLFRFIVLAKTQVLRFVGVKKRTLNDVVGSAGSAAEGDLEESRHRV